MVEIQCKEIRFVKVDKSPRTFFCRDNINVMCVFIVKEKNSLHWQQGQLHGLNNKAYLKETKPAPSPNSMCLCLLEEFKCVTSCVYNYNNSLNKQFVLHC